jgi:NADH:ubiquinone oxidoreductase subunit 5 (subunit L)/multisubunit Na+/H+ antiporter MnhA subunit
MPWTGAAFLVGSLAIAGLPPFNGFASEFLIYLAALRGGIVAQGGAGVAPLAVLGGLALIGGLAAACFARAFGIVFLGQPRTDVAESARDPAGSMRWTMAALAAGCVALGLGSPLVVGRMSPVIAALTGTDAGPVRATMGQAAAGLEQLVIGAIVVLAVVLAALAVRRSLLSRREVTRAGTWDCGYAAPTARMQYSGSSFSQPLTAMFRPVLRTRRLETSPAGPFPRRAALRTHAADFARDLFYAPLFGALNRWASRLRRLQHGRMHLYVLYVALTVIALLLWEMWLR